MRKTIILLEDRLWELKILRQDVALQRKNHQEIDDLDNQIDSTRVALSALYSKLSPE